MIYSYGAQTLEQKWNRYKYVNDFPSPTSPVVALPMMDPAIKIFYGKDFAYEIIDLPRNRVIVGLAFGSNTNFLFRVFCKKQLEKTWEMLESNTTINELAPYRDYDNAKFVPNSILDPDSILDQNSDPNSGKYITSKAYRSAVQYLNSDIVRHASAHASVIKGEAEEILDGQAPEGEGSEEFEFDHSIDGNNGFVKIIHKVETSTEGDKQTDWFEARSKAKRDEMSEGRFYVNIKNTTSTIFRHNPHDFSKGDANYAGDANSASRNWLEIPRYCKKIRLELVKMEIRRDLNTDELTYIFSPLQVPYPMNADIQGLFLLETEEARENKERKKLKLLKPIDRYGNLDRYGNSSVEVNGVDGHGVITKTDEDYAANTLNPSVDIPFKQITRFTPWDRLLPLMGKEEYAEIHDKDQQLMRNKAQHSRDKSENFDYKMNTYPHTKFETDLSAEIFEEVRESMERGALVKRQSVWSQATGEKALHDIYSDLLCKVDDIDCRKEIRNAQRWNYDEFLRDVGELLRKNGIDTLGNMDSKIIRTLPRSDLFLGLNNSSTDNMSLAMSLSRNRTAAIIKWLKLVEGVYGNDSGKRGLFEKNTQMKLSSPLSSSRAAQTKKTRIFEYPSIEVRDQSPEYQRLKEKTDFVGSNMLPQKDDLLGWWNFDSRYYNFTEDSTQEHDLNDEKSHSDIGLFLRFGGPVSRRFHYTDDSMKFNFLLGHVQGEKTNAIHGLEEYRIMPMVFQAQGLSECWDMINRRELADKFRYKYVLRIRPDGMFAAPLPSLTQTLFPPVVLFPPGSVAAQSSQQPLQTSPNDVNEAKKIMLHSKKGGADNRDNDDEYHDEYRHNHRLYIGHCRWFNGGNEDSFAIGTRDSMGKCYMTRQKDIVNNNAWFHARATYFHRQNTCAIPTLGCPRECWGGSTGYGHVHFDDNEPKSLCEYRRKKRKPALGLENLSLSVEYLSSMTKPMDREFPIIEDVNTEHEIAGPFDEDLKRGEDMRFSTDDDSDIYVIRLYRHSRPMWEQEDYVFGNCQRLGIRMDSHPGVKHLVLRSNRTENRNKTPEWKLRQYIWEMNKEDRDRWIKGDTIGMHYF